MRHLALNLLLAFVWALLAGRLSPLTLLVGFAVGAAVIGALRDVLDGSRYLRAMIGAAELVLVYSAELLVSSIELARDILRLRPAFRPAFVRVDVSDLRPGPTVLLANLVSLTPGTLSVDLEPDASAIYVHALYATAPERIRSDVRRLAERIRAAEGEPRKATRERRAS